MASNQANEGANSSETQNENNSHISADEIALYDRQIRLWGMKAQEKIRGANVLLIQMRGLGNEVAKNLVLAGIGKLTIVDHAIVAEEDHGSQFLLPSGPEVLGQNRAMICHGNLQRLNPRVTITYDMSDIRSKGPSFFAPFNIVIATDVWDPRTLTIINTATRAKGTPFYAASSHGMYGYIFADLVEHRFVVERETSNRVTVPGSQESRTCRVVGVQRKKNDTGKNVEMVTFEELYSTFMLADAAKLPEEIYKRRNRLKAVSPALPCFRALFEFAERNAEGQLPDKTHHQDIAMFTRLATAKKSALGLSEELKSDFLRGFLQGVGTELVAVTAIIGAQLAQDVINVLGGTQQPIQNMLIFDGNKQESNVYSLHPDGALGKDLLKWAESGVAVEEAVAAMATNRAASTSAGGVPQTGESSNVVIL